MDRLHPPTTFWRKCRPESDVTPQHSSDSVEFRDDQSGYCLKPLTSRNYRGGSREHLHFVESQHARLEEFLQRQQCPSVAEIPVRKLVFQGQGAHCAHHQTRPSPYRRKDRSWLHHPVPTGRKQNRNVDPSKQSVFRMGILIFTQIRKIRI
jgi:hypothetical protein